MQPSDVYPRLTEAMLLISHDSGGQHRGRDKRQQMEDWESLLAAAEPDYNLIEIEEWLADLDADDFETVCIGEVSEREELMEGGPAHVKDILELIFDEIA